MSALVDLARSLSKATYWLGVATVVLGVLAVLAPIGTGTALVVVVGLLLLAAGLVLCGIGWSARDAGHGSAGLAIGVLGALCGLALVLQPALGLWAVRWIVILWFAAGGVSQIMLALRIRPEDGWAWLVGGGIVSVLCGVSLFADWPLSGARAIGVLVGLNLIAGGVAVIRVHKALERLGEGARAVQTRLAGD